MRSDTIGSAFDTRCLRLIGCLAALVMENEACGNDGLAHQRAVPDTPRARDRGPPHSVTGDTVILGSRRRHVGRRCDLRESGCGDLGALGRVPAGGKRDESAAAPYCKASHAQVPLRHGLGRKLERPERIPPVGIRTREVHDDLGREARLHGAKRFGEPRQVVRIAGSEGKPHVQVAAQLGNREDSVHVHRKREDLAVPGEELGVAIALVEP